MRRENIQSKLLFGLCLLVCLCGCNSFLNVQPKGTVEQGKQFKDVQGYRDAMYGIYASMAQTSLYGKAMSYGFIDQVGQLFYDPYNGMADVYAATNFKYTDQAISETVDGIWSKAYECIMYVNNVIENVEKEEVGKDPDYTVIRGEAYALRAFLHFDLMRLFCDNIKINSGAGGIPYSYSFDLKNKRICTLKECYDNVLNDLTEAQKILVNDKLVKDSLATSVYRGTRYQHCNQYAVWALKARVFHYKGDLDSAAYNAEKVIAHPELRLTDSKVFAGVKRYGANRELIWGLYSNLLYTPYNDLFLKGSLGSGSVVRVREGMRSIYEVGSFEADSKDMRYTEFFTEDESISQQYAFTRLLKKEEQAYNFQGVCLVRLPEMYYILAEATYSQDKEKALRYLNDVRNSRGLKDLEISRFSTQDAFNKELLVERCREFWGEGQVFFSYKRDNCSFMNAANDREILPSTDVFVLPWPKSEQEFGGTNK